MPGYTYKPTEEIPKGQWRSYYGGFERTPFARYACGADVTEFTRDQSARARRARIRARKRAKLCDDNLEALLQASLDALDDEPDNTKEFHNGG